MSMQANRPSGFAYLSLLILIAVVGLTTSTTVTLGRLAQRRAAEQALLETGSTIQRAVESYIRATPSGQPMYPNSLEDLLRDPRFPGIRRHLRSAYADPMTGNSSWGIIASPTGNGLMGVYSLSVDPPIKKAQFESYLIGFDGAQSYGQWRFVVDNRAGAFANALVNPPTCTQAPCATP